MVVALAAGTLTLGTPAATAASAPGVTDTIGMGRTSSGDGMVFDPAHDALYVLNFRDDLVSVIDTTTNEVTSTIPVGDEPFDIAIDPDVDRAYVSNVRSGTVSVIDTDSRTVIHTLGGFQEPRGLDVDTSTHLLYVLNYWGGQNLVEVDPETDARTGTGVIESRPWALGVDSTTHRAYATTLFGQSFSTIENSTILDTMYPGGTGSQVIVDSEKKLAYLPHAGVMSAMDISEDHAVSTGTLPAGTTPSDVAIDKVRDLLYVSNSGDDTVSVIDRSTRTRLTTVPVESAPVAAEIDPASGRVYVLGGETVTVIDPLANQEITFTSTPPAATVGGTYTVTAVGGASNQPVTFSTISDTCTVSSAGAVSFDSVGDCVIRADQAGDAENLPGAANQTVTVGLNQTTTAVTLSSGSVVFGEPVTATATVSGASAGSVQFSLDGDLLGSAVPLDEGTAVAPTLTDLAVGSHPVGAVFTPADEDTHAASTATTQSLTVGQAATTTTMTVGGDNLSATVGVVAPGAGQPTGTVRFLVAGDEVGTAPLARSGVATLAYEVPAGAERQVTAVYDGDTSFSGSSASTARKDPVITAAVSSSKAKRNGWYSSAVTVTFRCEATSAALTDPCPAPVTLSRNAAGQSVTRTVVAAAGGAATVAVRGINVDRVRPTLRLKGVRAGATYFATGPKGTCVAKDSLSGVQKCTVKRTKRGSKLAYVVTATDRAGNTRTVRRGARSVSVFIEGAPMKKGKFVVHRGRNYRVLVAAKKRPRYIYAAPTPRRPAGGGTKFHRIGKNQWALGVTFDKAMKHHALWNIGTKVGSRTTVTTVRVVK